MAKRITYDDRFSEGAKSDDFITELLGEKSGETDSIRIKRILLNVINGELTEKQRNVVILYYFKGLNITQIAERTGITFQAVSATLARARLRIYHILKYYFD
ncbi:MAG: sigma-70 family RNA polymerase sigma factor [Ruminococcus sp.]|nr:sigma-70 family RNA polymerase sigma factor [Ruminococcus sp.]MDE6790021.1 sigma-70 family RNA polymerase sigma factor [Ruminococcus sp.]